MNVLLLCDHQLNIRYVDSSHPGACHDCLIWNTSDLRTHFEQKYLQGDGGYPLEPCLLTPHRTPLDDSPEMRFNETHAKCRNIGAASLAHENCTTRL
ncbi:putative nuclease HARBI1 [Lucilia cuprina]|nr:putative nuclease HARBI1 [Lucilia cuprina]